MTSLEGVWCTGVRAVELETLMLVGSRGYPLLTMAYGRREAEPYRFRTVSLGICAIRAAIRSELQGGLSVSDRERPVFTGVNGTLTARRFCPWTALMAFGLSAFKRGRYRVGTGLAGVLRCCRASLSVVGCCCCHRCCQRGRADRLHEVMDRS
jgi:hypothetical protein